MKRISDPVTIAIFFCLSEPAGRHKSDPTLFRGHSQWRELWLPYKIASCYSKKWGVHCSVDSFCLFYSFELLTYKPS
ncbi:hypothetical protein C0J52_04171 [Blattella germanica]|nr:hypothetical protein C0J52_04171 [Blattella germanica]